jgi:hypothetical protein
MGMGDKVLGVMSGRLELHGEERRGWTRLGATAAAGASDLVLAEQMPWRAGDRIVVASSDYDPMQAEEAVIASVSGASVRLEQPLRFAHWGEREVIGGATVDERAEVALLTRNITIEGDSASLATGIGAHVMVMQGAQAHVEGVTFSRVGQKARLARYPMHWHLVGAADGQYFRRNSVWKSFNRCLTLHGTDNVLVDGNVCHDHIGHGYFLEDGAETGNQLNGYRPARRGRPCCPPAASRRLLDHQPTTPTVATTPRARRNSAFTRFRQRRPASTSRPAPAEHHCASSGQRRPPTARRVSTWTMARARATPPRRRTTRRAPAPPAIRHVIADFTGSAAGNYRRAVAARPHLRRRRGAERQRHRRHLPAASGHSCRTRCSSARRQPRAGLPRDTVPRLRVLRWTRGADNVGSSTTPRRAASSSALGYSRRNASALARNFARGLVFENASELYLEEPHADKTATAAAFFDSTAR